MKGALRQKDTISIRDVDNYIANNKIGLDRCWAITKTIARLKNQEKN